MSVPVFQKGSWIQYPLPPQLDPLWSQSNIFKAASFYRTALSKGFSSEESKVLAECVVHKEVYPDLQYSPHIERKLLRLKDHVGTT